MMPHNQLSATKKALLAVQEMKHQIKEMKYHQTEPVAIVGMACHFPGGATTPDLYWQLLKEGKDAIVEMPSDRWNIDDYYDSNPDVPGKIYTRYGGFLSAPIDTFDPHFFGISPREACSIDPQHRMLLEVSWEALENANIIPASLYNSLTGVFIGITSFEYGISMLSPANKHNIDGYYGSGISLGVAAGRLSYTLGLNGPGFIIDTACSSSLVATHLACQSLRLKECNLAIVGGVNLMFTPEHFINFSKSRMLSPDGRCKTFDDRADGYGRGEGCGVIILKRLSDAIADNDYIWAQIRGSAVNQDGPSAGLTVPNGPSQEKVIRQALNSCSLKPEQISYIDAHGTGTSLGDPIEMSAIGNVYGVNRTSDNMMYVGSVKSNIGHLESAASVASIIKVALALNHKQIPPQLHFTTPSTYIDWDAYTLTIPTKLTDWNARDRRFAGVSSFSFSGTNAHVIIEEAPSAKPESEKNQKSLEIKTTSSFHLLTLSAKTPEALKALTARYQEYLENNPMDIGDICYSANTRRTHFDYRLSIVGDSLLSMSRQCQSFLTDTPDPLYTAGKVKKGKNVIAFLFTGQGAQYIQMGKQLYDTNAVFRDALDRCHTILEAHLEMPLLEILFPTSNKELLIDQTMYTQPALFALEYALAKVWESWGIKPDIVMGHSVGEYVAACISGVFDLEDGLRFIAKRANLMQSLCDEGDMIVVRTEIKIVEKIIHPFTQHVSIAAINGPENIVISGLPDIIQKIVSICNAQNIDVQQLSVSHAFHSPMMKAMISDFENFAKTVQFNAPKIKLYSNLTGLIATDHIATPQYWCDHILNPVQFYACMKNLAAENVDIYLEIGPKPTLLGMGRYCLPDDTGEWLPSLRYGHDEMERLFMSLGQLYTKGAKINWANVNNNYAGKTVQLPNYPFQKQAYWKPDDFTLNMQTTDELHPLLGEQKRTAICKNNEIIYETVLHPSKTAFMAHHTVFDMIVFPAAGHVEMILAAGYETFKTADLILSSFFIHHALIIPHDAPVTVQLILTPIDHLQYSIEIYSLENENWISHTSGIISQSNSETCSLPPIHQIKSQCTNEISADYYYQQAKSAGIEHGHHFQSLKKLWQSNDAQQILGEIQLPSALKTDQSDFYLHPVLLDACFQMSGVPLLEKNLQETWVPVGFEKLIVYQRPLHQLYCHMTLENDTKKQMPPANMTLISPEGQPIAFIQGLEIQKANMAAFQKKAPANKFQDWLYEINWEINNFHMDADFIPSPQEIQNSIPSDLINSSDLFEPYRKINNPLKHLCVAYILKAFHRLKWEWKQSECFTTGQFIDQLEISHQHGPFVNAMLCSLAEQGIVQQLRQSQNQMEIEWKVLTEPTLDSPDDLHEQLLAQFPELSPELKLLNHCARSVADVVQGKVNGVEVLFPKGDFSIVSDFYYHSQGLHLMNTIIQKSIEFIVSHLPDGKQLRILEIGAGTGCTTSYILPHLPVDRTDYVFTDISPLFLEKAQNTFKAYPFLNAGLLDIEKQAEDQRFDDHHFDIILASNVIHATKDLNQTMDHMDQLLNPGGIIILLEGTTRHIWLDLIFGLTAGWWRFEDTILRPDYALMPPAKWQKLFDEKGFHSHVTIAPDENQQAIYIVQKIKQKEVNIPKETWFIFANSEKMGEQLAKGFQRNQWQCMMIFPGQQFEAIDDKTMTIRPDCYDDFETIFKLSEFSQAAGILFAWGIDPIQPQKISLDDLKHFQKLSCGSLLHILHALGRNHDTKQLSLILLTQGAVSIDNTQQMNPSQSSLWGFGRTIISEKPELNCRLIDLDPEMDCHDVSMLMEALKHPEHDPQIAFRHQCCYAARLQKYKARLLPEADQLNMDENKSYWITGGLGDLGLLFAQWMVEAKQVKHLILSGRSEPSPEVENKINQLRKTGARIKMIQADVSSDDQLSAAIKDIQQNNPPLRGIFHFAASQINDATIDNQNWSKFEKLMIPKIYGSWNLHQLTSHLDLDFFILFSSAASILGSHGQSNYASASAFLDALAAYRRSIGLPGLSINWSAWSEIGQAATHEIEHRLSMRGIHLIAPHQGLMVFDDLLSQDTSHVGVLPIQWDQFLQWEENPFYGNVETEKDTICKEDKDFSRQIQSLEGIELREYLIDFVQSQISKVLYLKEGQSIDIHDGFFDIGMDSLTAAELKNIMQMKLGCTVPSTVLFRYPTIDKLVDYIYELFHLNKDATVKKDETDTSENILDDVQGLSDDDLEALIDEEFESLTMDEDE
jgi:acyl transferase domain-containing protein/ubiquinone/menaquinone biosynthesis C-methylase UbiE/acyl carrier protein